MGNDYITNARSKHCILKRVLSKGNVPERQPTYDFGSNTSRDAPIGSVSRLSFAIVTLLQPSSK